MATESKMSKRDFNRPVRLDKNISLNCLTVVDVLELLEKEEQIKSKQLSPKSRHFPARQEARNRRAEKQNVYENILYKENYVETTFNPYATIFLPKIRHLECSSVSVTAISLNLIKKHRHDIVRNDPKQHTTPKSHAHCDTCFDPKCRLTDTCPIIQCSNGCKNFFHACTQVAHNDTCSIYLVPCPDILRTRENEYMRYSETDHFHCASCVDMNCKGSRYCNIRTCANTGCTIRLHSCKQEDHNTICPYKVTTCINKQHGCLYSMGRYHLLNHLQRCTAMDWMLLSVTKYNPKLKREHCVHHCHTCVSNDCNKPVLEKCRLISCGKGCGLKFHKCKLDEHRRICPHEVIGCINKQYGCQMVLTRCMMVTHLLHCPLMNWSQLKSESSAIRYCPADDRLTKGTHYECMNEQLYLSLIGDEHIYESIRLPLELPLRERSRKTKLYNQCMIM